MAGLRIPDFTRNLNAIWDAERAKRGGVSQKQWAKEHDIDQQSLSDWLGGVQPELENVKRLAEAFGVAWQWLLVGDDGAKALARYAPHEPIVIEMEDRTFQVAKYQRTEPSTSGEGVSRYRISHRKVKALSTAVSVALTQR